MISIDSTYQCVIGDALDGETLTTRNSEVHRALNLSAKFISTPLVSLRRTAWKSALQEMEWFLSGSNLVSELPESPRKWWTPWANEDGRVPGNYSSQLRGFAGFVNGKLRFLDQIEYLITSLRDEPASRRAVITTWNTTEMASPITPITNCHGTVIQCFVRADNSLDMFMYQRSADMIVGVPHNWIQYWALLQYLAHRSGRIVGSFTWMGGDCHVYRDHYDLAERMARATLNVQTPQLAYAPTSEEFTASDFSLDGDYTVIIDESAKLIV